MSRHHRLAVRVRQFPGGVLLVWLSACLAAGCLIAGCGDSSPPATPSPPPSGQPRARLLAVTHTEGFRHGSIPVAEATLAEIGRSSGTFDVDYCRTAADVRRMLTADGLAPYAAVFFANTTGDLGIPDMAAFLAWIGSGRAFLGAHSASDTYHSDPRFLEMLGNEFETHGDQTEVDIVVDDRSHPATSTLGARLRVFDEIYRFRFNNRGRVGMLLSLDRFPQDGLPSAGQPGDLPMAWQKSHGSGRVFYTALGHRDEVWQDARFRQHLSGAIQWAISR
jgi:type 1 glutamine amidotransferase